MKEKWEFKGNRKREKGRKKLASEKLRDSGHRAMHLRKVE